MIGGLARIQASLGLRVESAAADSGYGPLSAFIETFGTRMTAAGVSLTPRRAMQVSSVHSCVTILSEAVAALPLHVHMRKQDGGKDRAVDHPLYRLLHDQTSARHTAVEWRSLMQRDVETEGNAYAVKVRVNGRLEQLPYIEAGRMAVEESDRGELFYKIRSRGVGTTETYPADRILHLRGPHGDGVVGAAPVYEHRETFGLAYAIDAFLAHSFANGVRPSIALSSPSKLSDKAYLNLKTWLNDEAAGYLNAGKPLLLEEGTKPESIGQTNEQGQVADLHERVTAAVARIYSVPLHMLASNIAQPRANMEQQGAEFVSVALRPRLERWKQRIAASLLDGDPKFFAEFLLEDLLRGDAQSRAAVYRSLIELGVMTRNEARIRENLDPLPGLDEPLTPLNMDRGRGVEDLEDDARADLVLQFDEILQDLGVKADIRDARLAGLVRVLHARRPHQNGHARR